jgi:hypothetical protein
MDLLRHRPRRCSWEGHLRGCQVSEDQEISRKRELESEKGLGKEWHLQDRLYGA